MAKYKLLGGRHVDEEGTVFDRGAIIESTDNLMEKWVNKFERIHEDISTVPSSASSTAVPKKSYPSEAVEDSLSVSKLGKDVTSKFPEVEKEELQVYSKGGKYFVVDPDEDTTKYVNEKGLKKTEVNKFVDKYLGE